MDSTYAVVAGVATATLGALAATLQARAAKKSLQGNGHGTVSEMLEYLVEWAETVDYRLDHLSRRLNAHIDRNGQS